MEFVGLDPFRSPMDVEVRHEARVFDLHNTGWLRELAFRPQEHALILTWSIEEPPDQDERTTTAWVTLRFEDVRDVECQLLNTVDHHASVGSLELDGFFRMPEANGEDWLEIQFVGEERVEFRATRCVATVQMVPELSS